MNFKLLLLSTVFIVISTFSYAQVPQWVNTMGSSSVDEGMQCRTMPNGNVVVSGHYTGTIDIDPGAGTSNLTSHNGTRDVFVACYTATGSLVWGFSLGKEDIDGINALTVDANNNIYIGGYFRGTNVDFDPGVGNAFLTCAGFASGASDWGGDCYIAKYSSTGGYQWANFGSSWGNEATNDIVIDNLGNILVVSGIKDKVDVDVQAGITILDAATMGTTCLAKYNSSMQLQWAFCVGLPGGMTTDNGIRAVKTDASNNVYIGGFITGGTNVDFDPGAGVVNHTVSGLHNAFVAKYSSAGAHIFSFVIGNSSTDDIFDLDLDASANIYVTGYSIGTSIDYDPTAATAIATAPGAGLNIMLASYTSSGQYRWGKLIGNSGTDFGRRLSVKGSVLYTGGMFSGTVDFNPGGNAANQSSAGNTDAYIAQYELNGNYRFGFNGKEKDNELKGRGNSIDFGARMHDTRLGRWLSVDPLAGKYPGQSPYNFALNTPIQAVDPDGKIVVFVNGFMLDQWKHSDNRRYKDFDPDPKHAQMGINPNYRPYPTNEMSTKGPTYLGKQFWHWGGIDDKFKRALKDPNALYVSGSNGRTSQAIDRFNAGMKSGNEMVQKIVSGEIKLSDNETIKIVGHSQGAAHAAGMGAALQNAYNAGIIKNKVEQIFYLAPHQPTDITSPAGIFSTQYSRMSDRVSSVGPVSTGIISGGSEYGEIQGVSEMVQMPDMNTDRGGHNVETYEGVMDIPQSSRGGVSPTVPTQPRQ